MNVILKYSDHYFLDNVYPESWPRNDIYRQIISTLSIEMIGSWILYLVTGVLSYHFFFDKTLIKNKLFLRDQIRQEIHQSLMSLPLMSLLTLPIFIGQIRGFSCLYEAKEGVSISELLVQFLGLLFFTDMAIYWIHRWLHNPLVYNTVHKPHHKWVVPTPFASHAFHPLDGFLQSVPYHIYVFMFPMEEHLFLALFILVNVWSTSIHDGNHQLTGKVINSAACHTLHHREFNYNYGQYFTLWDRIGGTYRSPQKYCK